LVTGIGLSPYRQGKSKSEHWVAEEVRRIEIFVEIRLNEVLMIRTMKTQERPTRVMDTSRKPG
jgi:hypothetical protein